MTLWLPLLDYARSYAPMSRQIARLVDKNACIEIFGVGGAQAAAFQYHGKLELRQTGPGASCPYLIVDSAAQPRLAQTINLPDWAFQATVRRPTDKNDNVAIYKRVNIQPPAANKKSASPATGTQAP